MFLRIIWERESWKRKNLKFQSASWKDELLLDKIAKENYCELCPKAFGRRKPVHLHADTPRKDAQLYFNL